MNKEQAYDAKISPLMSQVIAACKEHGICMFATFEIPTEDDPDLACTTCLPDETGKLTDRIREAVDVAINGRRQFVAMTITKGPKP